MASQPASRKKGLDKDSLPVRLVITDVEKKRGLSKYYVYVIIVTCKNGSSYSIYRRYRQFDEMQRHLEQRFPVDAGEFNQKERTLPNLPGKVIFGRSAVRDVTDRRIPLLNDYLKQLFQLPDNIRYDSIVRAFFKGTAQDRQTGGGGGDLSSSQNRTTQKPAKPPRPTIPVPTPVRKKSPAPPRPAPPSRPRPPVSIQGPRVKALYSYTAQYADELTFQADDVIALMRKVDGNWYQCRLQGQIGLVPVNYVRVVQPLIMTQQNSQDDAEQSDEWDSDQEETDSSRGSSLTFYSRGVPHTVRVSADLLRKPTLQKLRSAVQEKLGRHSFVLNYKDSTGDLIELVDQSDVTIMMSDGTSPRSLSRPSSSPLWTLYITDQGDHTAYNTHPYSTFTRRR